MNRLIVPYINPLHYTVQGYVQDQHYQSRHFDDFDFKDIRLSFEEYVSFYQPWQQSDSIRQQFQSDFSPIVANVIDVNGKVWYSAPFAPVRVNKNDSALFIYESDISLSILPAGIYQMRIDCGSPVSTTLLSNYFTVDAAVPESLLLEYTNYQYYADVFFETGFSPMLRVYGFNRYKGPGSRITGYEDQPADYVTLKKWNYRTYEFTTRSEGIPDYLIDMIDRIFGCSSLKIDDRYFSIADGAKWSVQEEAYYTMKGWSIDLREAQNRDSRIYQNSTIQLQQRQIMSVADSRGFGQDTVGGSEYQIVDVQ